jgi:hypothetical protein
MSNPVPEQDPEEKKSSQKVRDYIAAAVARRKDPTLLYLADEIAQKYNVPLPLNEELPLVPFHNFPLKRQQIILIAALLELTNKQLRELDALAWVEYESRQGEGYNMTFPGTQPIPDYDAYKNLKAEVERRSRRLKGIEPSSDFSDVERGSTDTVKAYLSRKLNLQIGGEEGYKDKAMWERVATEIAGLYRVITPTLITKPGEERVNRQQMMIIAALLDLGRDARDTLDALAISEYGNSFYNTQNQGVPLSYDVIRSAVRDARRRYIEMPKSTSLQKTPLAKQVSEIIQPVIVPAITTPLVAEVSKRAESIPENYEEGSTAAKFFEELMIKHHLSSPRELAEAIAGKDSSQVTQLEQAIVDITTQSSIRMGRILARLVSTFAYPENRIEQGKCLKLLAPDITKGQYPHIAWKNSR